jgi:SAM-dependent methyltransferase
VSDNGVRCEPGKVIPLPPVDLRLRVAGSQDEGWFESSGTRTVNEWERALACFDKKLTDFQTIIDFGCGCGRALRHLKPRLASGQRLIGLDTDSEAIRWIEQNLSGVEAYALAEHPPIDSLDANAANLVLCHSVFTHLPEEVQFEWLAELARLLCAGGILVASIHGSPVTAAYCSSLRAKGLTQEADHLSEQFERHGFLHLTGKASFETALASYYGAAFHDIGYVAEQWTNNFKLLAWLPTFALDHQDLLVLSKTSCETSYRLLKKVRARAAYAGRDAALAEGDAAYAGRDAALAERDAALRERDAAVADRDSAAAEFAAVKEERDQALEARDAAITEHANKNDALCRIQDSIAWRIASPLWRLETRGERNRRRSLK